jgi:CheY-like chemotaxis protein
MDERKILLVEDNPDDIELTLRALERSKIANEVIVAHDGEEALNYLFCRGAYEMRDRNVMPAVVLLDLNMPKVSGLEVLRQIRSHNPTKLLPVVIMTSSNEEQDVMNGYALGANSYIRKPVDFEQFAESVHHLGLYWLLLNEPPPVVKE